MRALLELRPWLKVMLERRRRLLLGAALMLVTLASALGLLSLSGWFITATAVAALAAQAAYLDVFTPGAGIRGFAVSRTVARYLERLYNHDTVLRLLADLRTRAFGQLVALDGRTLSRARASQWLNRLTADIDTLDNLYLRLLAPPLVALVGILTFAGLAALFLPVVAGTLLALMLPLWCLITLGCAAWGWRHAQQRVDGQEALRVRTIEHVDGLPELTAYRVLAEHRRHWREEEATLLAHQRTLGRRAAAGNALVTLIVQASALAVLVLAIMAYQAGTVSGPVMVMLALGTLALGEGLGGLPAAFTQLGATQRAAVRLNRQTELGSKLVGESLTTGGAAPSLSYRDIGVRHAAHVALQHYSLALAPGERVAVIGPSGSGKSTLAQLAVRAFDPDEGEVRFDDRLVADLDPESLRARIGYLTQRTELFHDTLAANLRMGSPEASDEALWQVLAQVELREWAEGLPQGLETWVGEQGRQVSGGQARRIALARVILRDSPLVILDEPLSGLDGETAARIQVTLDRWLGKRTALLLAHDRSALPPCDRYHQLMP
ncbi:thiol reductant ABC exporter subunit CydC [Salinicola avicenniae]|uniref:thiol reductant ABC exporter subunit CydC n=1 Tax=Salinicola avicenniae TaxID=2916836 RepID=UPI002072FC87|nr:MULTISPECIES: thiol reductant ABC exporter subunit CydC [unclassified Salinicola]